MADTKEIPKKPMIYVNVHITIKIENIHEGTSDRAQQIANRITKEESVRVRERLQCDLSEEFGVNFVGAQADV